MNRRNILMAASAAPAFTLGATLTALAAPAFDEFDALIQAAVDGDEAYNTHPLAEEVSGEEEVALVASTYGPPFDRLCDGDLPTPLSAAAAAAGLRYCQKDHNLDLAEAAIVDAVIRFLEGGRLS
jgi:hypothetical protein